MEMIHSRQIYKLFSVKTDLPVCYALLLSYNLIHRITKFALLETLCSSLQLPLPRFHSSFVRSLSLCFPQLKVEETHFIIPNFSTGLLEIHLHPHCFLRMGSGRKTETNSFMERVPRSPSVNCSTTARNLRINDLGGVILGCTRYTMEECLSNQLFGLPVGHFAYIKKIKPGLPLFLFNYSDRKLHGIFEATSNGELNINPYGWSEDGTELTKYPAQVRVRIRKQCKSLSEQQYRPILMDNYYTEDHFWFELDRVQAGKLITLFESSLVAKPKQAFNYNKKVKSGRVSEGKALQYASKWDVLQDMNSEDDRTTTISEIGSSSATSLEKEMDEELIYLKLLQIVNEREKAKANCGHWLCRTSVSKWFSAVPLSGYVALVFIAWVCLRLYSAA